MVEVTVEMKVVSPWGSMENRLRTLVSRCLLSLSPWERRLRSWVRLACSLGSQVWKLFMRGVRCEFTLLRCEHG